MQPEQVKLLPFFKTEKSLVAETVKQKKAEPLSEDFIYQPPRLSSNQ
jgi:hypothetical protein